MSGIDYIVPSRSVGNIAAEIELLRPYIRTEYGSQVDVVGFLEFLVSNGVYGREFRIELFDAPEDAELWKLAYVRMTDDKLFLYCDERLWFDAKAGDPDARYMLAHEAGHLVLHTNKSMTRHFSEVKAQALEAQEENRSEWQAHQFAEMFLVPSSRRLTCISTVQIATKYGVPKNIAEMAQKRSATKYAFDYEGESCSECGNFTLVRSGTRLKCDTCGSTSNCD